MKNPQDKVTLAASEFPVGKAREADPPDDHLVRAASILARGAIRLAQKRMSEAAGGGPVANPEVVPAA